MTLDDILSRLGALPEGEKQKIESAALEATAARRFVPNIGPQTQAYFSLADEVFYGGGAGGGKSALLCGLAVEEHRKAIIFRREYPQIKGLVDEVQRQLGTRAGFNASDRIWRLPNGNELEFGSVQHEDDKEKYQGRAHDLKGFDEITHFSESQYRFLIGWNRSADASQRCRVVATGNPPISADCFMYGFVTRKAETVSPAEIDVAISVVSAVGITASNWEIQIIAGPALGFESDTLAISDTSVPIALGAASFTVAPGKFLPETASVLIRDLANAGNYMYGTVVSYSGATLVVQLRNVFGAGTSSAWAIRLLDGPSVVDALVAEDWGLIADVAAGSAGGADDYRFVAESITLSDDCGLVTAVVTETSNYGAIP